MHRHSRRTVAAIVAVVSLALALAAAPAVGTATPYDAVETASVDRAKPKGTKKQWSYVHSSKARWNPCKPIRWAYNPRGGYQKALKHTKKAVKRIRNRTGLPLTYAGRTKFTGQPFTRNPAGIDIVVRWAKPKNVKHLRGGLLGYGGGLSGTRDTRIPWEIHNGFVVLNQTRKGHLRKGFAKRGRPTWGQVITHELLHVVGLGHTNGRQQLMHHSAHAGNHGFGKGDLAGMKALGAKQGCLNAGMR